MTAPVPAGPVLELDGVRHSFGGNHVLKGVALQVLPQSVTALIGPNGSGKTTTFNVVSGFLRPDAGQVRFDGRDVAALAVPARSRLGMMRTFQAPQLFGDMTVAENLVMGRYKLMRSGFAESMLLRRRASAELRAASDEAHALLERYGLLGLAGRSAGGLPAGSARLVEVLRAAMSRPRLLMLDEPSSGLNADEVDSFAAVLRGLRDDGTSVLLVSHDMGLVATLADTTYVLDFGQIIASGAPADISRDPRVREVYLGTSPRRVPPPVPVPAPGPVPGPVPGRAHA